MKRCPRCRETKPMAEFYRNKSRHNGRGEYCKICTKILINNSRSSPKAKKKAKVYAKTYRRSEEGKAAIKAYTNTKAFKAKSVVNSRRYSSTEKGKSKARKRLKTYTENLTDGYIKKVLLGGRPVSSMNIPIKLIETKREQIKIKRYLKEHK